MLNPSDMQPQGQDSTKVGVVGLHFSAFFVLQLLYFVIMWLCSFSQVFLSMVHGLEKLAKAASSKARETKETVITERHIRSVIRVSDHALAIVS